MSEDEDRESSFSFLLESVLLDVEILEGELSPLTTTRNYEEIMESATTIIESYDECCNVEQNKPVFEENFNEDDNCFQEINEESNEIQPNDSNVPTITIKVPTPRERVRKMPNRPPPQVPQRVARIKSDSEVKNQFFTPKQREFLQINDEIRMERSNSVPGHDNPQRNYNN